MSQTNELAFESHVANILHDHSGWHPGLLAEWDCERALFPAVFWLSSRTRSMTCGNRCGTFMGPAWKPVT